MQIVHEARSGDRESLNTLATMVRARVWPYFRAATRHEHQADDLAQETVIVVLQSLATLRQVERFWPWVFRIAANKARSHYRSESRRRAVQISAVEETVKRVACDKHREVLALLSQKELQELARSAVKKVDGRYRGVLSLRFFEEMPYHDVAQVLGCSRAYARAMLWRAKRALRRELGTMAAYESLPY